MCGIAGWYSKEYSIDKNKFDKMVDIIDYRGPDDRGTFYEGGLALGHRRLAILDISAAGHQPFEYEDKYVLVYNGEIYNYIELRDELTKDGYRFKTGTDTEVLIATYDKYKERCVEKFVGMWAFAIYDRQRRELFCSRDRFGVKPFYYHYENGELLFGSEIKQLLLMLDEGQQVNRKRLLEYLIRGYSDFTEETMIEGIFELRGGHNLLFDINTQRLQIRKYYDINDCLLSEEAADENKSIEHFRNDFIQSVNLRLRSDVPLGYCLSGGLDSSAIVCTADMLIKQRKSNTYQKSISSCFEDKRYDEQEYIDEVLRNTNVDGYKTFLRGDNLFDELDKVIWHMDEPFSSTSQYAQWNVFKVAKQQGLIVMLDGQGADEQLAGYTGFYSVIFAEYLKKFKFISFFRELRQYKKLRADTEKYVKSYKIIVEALISAYLPRKLQKYGKLKLFYLKQGFPFTDKDIKDTITGLDLYPANDSRRYILDNYKCNLSMLLRYEDRNSMAHSVESRVPFLDHRLAETIYKMPINFKIRNGVTKYVMREGLKGILPEKIRNRYSKLGFVTPEDQWINANPKLFRSEIEKSGNVLKNVIDVDKLMQWYDKISGNVQRMNYMPFRIICAGHWVEIFKLKV